MKIKHLELEQFRNYEKLSIDLHEGTNLFYGDNAQGKTNILEAVYLCGTTKSHRSAKEKEMIRFEQPSCHISMEIGKEETEYKIDLNLFLAGKKSIFINRVPVKKASQLLSLGHYVFFSPEDLKIIKSGPGERRRFMDLELCQFSPVYIRDLASYNHILSQRSALFRNAEGNRDLLDTLPIWDEQLVRYGKKVISARKEFIRELNDVIIPIHEEITGGREKIEILYDKSVGEEELEEKIVLNREKDILYKATQAGPHRDDLIIKSNDTDLKKYGSQGQQRTAALSMKLAEIELVKKKREEDPVLLLDDVLSELDEKRQQYLLERIKQIQTLITCTGLHDFEKAGFNIDRTFFVSGGKVC